MDLNYARERAVEHRMMCNQVKQLIVERLEIPIDPEWIADDQPLIARGLELDSVDTLELTIGVEATFGATITDDEVGVFGSVSKLVQRIQAGTPLTVVSPAGLSTTPG